MALMPREIHVHVHQHGLEEIMTILDDIRAAQATDALDELKSLRDQVQRFLDEGITQERGQEILNAMNAGIAKKEEALAAVSRVSTDE